MVATLLFFGLVVGPACPGPLAVPDAELFPGWLTDQAVKRSR